MMNGAPASLEGARALLEAAGTEPGTRDARGWEARLDLGFEVRGDRTALVHRAHVGPLAVQRAFYPEPDGTCHVYVLHPPGGVVGGDRLTLDVRAGTGARVLVTTPAANKLYRSGGRLSHIAQHLSVAAGARLEWLPQENIVYDGAQAEIDTCIDLEPGAALLAWDITCLGRPANGELLTRGHIEQRLHVARAGQPLLLERARYDGGGDALRSAFGLGGQPVTGVLLCIGGALDDRTADDEALLADVRLALHASAGAEAVCTRLAHALVCRYRGPSVERAQLAFRAAWAVLRTRCFGTEAVPPRIWAT
jgi:urease accessory protein